MAQMRPLRRRMIDDMTVRNLSPATQQSYVYAVAKFSRFFGCSPDRLGLHPQSICIDHAYYVIRTILTTQGQSSG